METHVILLQLAAILVCARVFSLIAGRLGAPTIIGELFAGIFLGPTVLGWIEPHSAIQLLAQIGIILLLFEVGLSSDISRLLKSGSRSVIVAIGGFVFPFFLGAAVSYYFFGFSPLVAMFVGGTLTATSIGVTIRILSDLNQHQSREGQIVLGAAVVDDILGVILLTVLYEFSQSGEVSLERLATITVYVFAFLSIAPMAAKLFSFLLNRFTQLYDSPGLIPVSLVSLVLVFAAIAHSLGAPELLGGFAAGLALSRRFFLPFGAAFKTDPQFTEKIRAEISPIIHLFTPIFFVTVGLSLDLTSIDWGSSFFWLFSLSMLFVAVLGKLLGGWIVPETYRSRTLIGMAMVPRGEVGLIFAELGHVANVLTNEVYAAMIIVVAYTTVLSPFWIKLYFNKGKGDSNNKKP